MTGHRPWSEIKHKRDPLGWPVDESPRPCYPDRVLWEGNEYEVEDIDILGRWNIVRDEDEWFERRAVEVWELEVPETFDARPVYGPPDQYERMLRAALDTYRTALVQQLEQPIVLLRYLERD